MGEAEHRPQTLSDCTYHPPRSRTVGAMLATRDTRKKSETVGTVHGTSMNRWTVVGAYFVARFALGERVERGDGTWHA